LSSPYIVVYIKNELQIGYKAGGIWNESSRFFVISYEVNPSLPTILPLCHSPGIDGVFLIRFSLTPPAPL
jgi:hypothetical protein